MRPGQLPGHRQPDAGPARPGVASAEEPVEELAAGGFADLGRPQSPLRVVVSTRHPTLAAPVSREVKLAVQDTAAILEAEGHLLERADPPYSTDFAVRFLRRSLPGIAEDAQGLDQTRLERRTRKMARAGRFLARRGWSAPAESDSWRRTVGRWFEGRDLLLMPVLAYTAPAVGRWQRSGWFTSLLSASRWAMTAQWNLAGMAAASVPAGVATDGLPLAVQLVAPAGSERLLLEVARRIEARRPFPKLPAA